jgi:rhodanese-related sulfurtransferase
MEVDMLLITIWAVGAIGVLAIVGWRVKKARDERELAGYSIDPEELRELMESDRKVLLFDIRQPLDLLANSEIIPGSVRIPPQELIEDPSRIPIDEDSVVYCTCPGEKTSRSVVRRALALKLMRVKLLKGGLAAWKAKGYPVEPYLQSFRLDTAR